MADRIVEGSVELRWNDPATILAGGYWALRGPRAGAKRTTLHHLVGVLPPDPADGCVEAHVGFLADLLEALDGLQRTLTDGFGADALGQVRIDAGSPLGATCQKAAAALDAHLYDLSRALHRRDATLGPRATRLVLDAAQVSVYLRSLTGAHAWPVPAGAP